MKYQVIESVKVVTPKQLLKAKLHQIRLNTLPHTKAECGSSGCQGFYVKVASNSLVVKGAYIHDGKLWKVVRHKPWPMWKLL